MHLARQIPVARGPPRRVWVAAARPKLCLSICVRMYYHARYTGLSGSPTIAQGARVIGVIDEHHGRPISSP
jgi:hypothetical protein